VGVGLSREEPLTSPEAGGIVGEPMWPDVQTGVRTWAFALSGAGVSAGFDRRDVL
jgi:hypothetical protein